MGVWTASRNPPADGAGRNGGFLAEGRASAPGPLKLPDERLVFWLCRGRADRRKSTQPGHSLSWVHLIGPMLFGVGQKA